MLNPGNILHNIADANRQTSNRRFDLFFNQALRNKRRKDILKDEKRRHETRVQDQIDREKRILTRTRSATDFQAAQDVLTQALADPDITDADRQDLLNLQDFGPDQSDELSTHTNKIQSRLNQANTKRARATQSLKYISDLSPMVKSPQGKQQLFTVAQQIRKNLGYAPLPDNIDFSDPEQFNKAKLKQEKEDEKEDKDRYNRGLKRLNIKLKEIDEDIKLANNATGMKIDDKNAELDSLRFIRKQLRYRQDNILAEGQNASDELFDMENIGELHDAALVFVTLKKAGSTAEHIIEILQGQGFDPVEVAQYIDFMGIKPKNDTTKESSRWRGIFNAGVK